MNDFAVRWFEFARDLAEKAGEHLTRGRAELNLIALQVALCNDRSRMGEPAISAWEHVLKRIESVLSCDSGSLLPEDLYAAFMTNRAIALWRLGRLWEAEGLFRAQVRRFLEFHNFDRFTAASFYLSDMLLQKGDAAAALDVCLKAIDVCDREGVRPQAWSNLLELASTIAENSGDFAAAFGYLQKRGTLRDSFVDDQNRSQAAILAGRIAEVADWVEDPEPPVE